MSSSEEEVIGRSARSGRASSFAADPFDVASISREASRLSRLGVAGPTGANARATKIREAIAQSFGNGDAAYQRFDHDSDSDESDELYRDATPPVRAAVAVPPPRCLQPLRVPTSATPALRPLGA